MADPPGTSGDSCPPGPSPDPGERREIPPHPHKAKLLQYCQGLDLTTCQPRFDAWRLVYNLERPHEALGMAGPGQRYRESPRSFPERLPAIESAPGDVVRKVQQGGAISYQNRPYRLSKAWRREYVALGPTRIDGLWEVFFCNQRVAKINARDGAVEPR